MPISRTAPLPALLWVFLCFVTPAAAATLNVPTTAYPTIQAAVNAAASGDTVLVADGTYSGPGNRDIDFNGKNLTVTSQHGAASTVIDCGGTNTTDGSGNHRGFYLHSAETNAVIRGFTVKNGYEHGIASNPPDNGYGAGLCIDGSSAVIQECIVSGNTANYDGGGIFNYCRNNSTVTLTNCVISANTSNYDGGGIFNGGDDQTSNNSNANPKIVLTNCTISGNTAGSNGGGVENINSSSGSIILTACTITGNTANLSARGGGVDNENVNPDVIGTITLTNCVISGNTVAGNGGGINDYNVRDGIITITNCTVFGNIASYSAPGILNENSAAWFGYGAAPAGVITLANDVVYANLSTFYGTVAGEVGDATNRYSPASVAYCDVQGGYIGPGNIDVDPLFVRATTGDLHLKPNSPCSGKGTAGGTPVTDKDGVARPNPPSIGAYEATPSHTHLLWNNSDGRVMFWNVAPDGSFAVSGFGPYTDDYVSSDPNNKWSATAVASAPDGTSRIVWNNVDHRVMLWSLDPQGNILSITGYGPYTDNYVNANPGNLWSVVGVSVGPGGLTHLLWSNTDRRMMFWDLDAQGDLLGLSGYGPYTDDYVSSAPANVWSATALATGPDNISRVVWNNVDHRVMLWTLGGPGGSSVRGIAGYGPYTDNAPQNLWSAAGVSVGPDNLTHLLWSNTDRRAMFWNVDSAFGFALAGYGPYTDNGANNLWSAAAVATGPDGLSHILWGNTDYRAMLWGVDNSFDFTVAGYGPYTDNGPGNLWSATALSAGP